MDFPLTAVSTHFSINISLSALSYVLMKVLVQCMEFALNYFDDIMVFSETWKSHLKHFEEVFKWLQDTDLKINCSKCEFFKSEVYYLVYLVGTYWGAAIARKGCCHTGLEPPKDLEELQYFLGLVGFYRKFIPFFADITPCLNTMLQKGAVFKWTQQCNNAFNLLKSDLVEMPRLSKSQ